MLDDDDEEDMKEEYKSFISLQQKRILRIIILHL